MEDGIGRNGSLDSGNPAMSYLQKYNHGSLIGHLSGDFGPSCCHHFVLYSFVRSSIALFDLAFETSLANAFKIEI